MNLYSNLHLLLFIILCLVCFASLESTSDLETDETTLRQTNIFEWLTSIFSPKSTTTTTTTTTTPGPPQRDCPECTCGLINTMTRIIGGQETVARAYPWMTLLMANGTFYCGGSLINDLYVATAAHCLTFLQPEELTMRFLVHDQFTESMFEIDRNASLIVVHENYNRTSKDNDIGLIRLSEPVELINGLRPICMPENRDFAGELAIATGWGRRENGIVSNKLREVQVPILSNQRCRDESYLEASSITDNMLCAGLREGGKDACRGDSGGPLHVRINNNSMEYQLAGIVSWGEGCGLPRRPGVYARVTRYVDWYAQRTRDGCSCGTPSSIEATTEGTQEVDSQSTSEATSESTSEATSDGSSHRISKKYG